MNKGINYAYQELETAIVNQINGSGLPIFAVRDMLNRLLLQVDKQTTDRIEMEKKAYFDGLEAEKKAAQSAEPEATTAETVPTEKKAAQSAEPEATTAETVPTEKKAAQSAEPEAATAETVPTGKEEPHA